MPAHMISGLPGSGKSLYGIWWVRQYQQTEAKAGRQRPVYVSGITGLSPDLGWKEIGPETQLAELPDGAIIIIDECQRWFPTRGVGSPPANERYVETHRHQGHDLFLITQDPRNISSHVRRLVSKHWHLLRLWGGAKSRVFEWEECQENPRNGRAVGQCQKRTWRHPKEVYALYQSSSLHTVTPGFPWRTVLPPVLLLLAGLSVFGWWAYGQLARPQSDQVEASPSAGAPVVRSVASGVQVQRGVPMSAEGAARFHQPLVPGIPGTAPIYWEAYTTIKDYPRIAGCVINVQGDQCRCYTQQGTRTYVPPVACERYSQTLPFDHSRERRPPTEQSAPPPELQADDGLYVHRDGTPAIAPLSSGRPPAAGGAGTEPREGTDAPAARQTPL